MFWNHVGSFYRLAFAGALIALALSILSTRWASATARGIVFLISLAAASFMACGAIFLARFGAAFGSRLMTPDMLLLTSLWSGVAYFVYAGVALWLPGSPWLRRSVILAHLFLMPAVAITPALVVHSPERWTQIAVSLFLGSCYALLWLRVHDTRDLTLPEV